MVEQGVTGTTGSLVPTSAGSDLSSAAISYPWLESVSDDLCSWVVQDGAGTKRETRRIELDVELSDGSSLPDEQNRALFGVIVEYLQNVRLFAPEISAESHRKRISALVTFVYWLNLHKVRSLSDVTSDHVDLYSSHIAFGMEWAAEAPQRLLSYLRRQIECNRLLPRDPRSKKLLRNQILSSAGVGWPTLNSNKPKCAAVFNWIEERGGLPDRLPTLSKILEDQDQTPREMTIQTVLCALAPLEELWFWKHQSTEPNLTFNPFPRGSHKAASRLGREGERHPTIPPKLALRYLNCALTWVLQFAPIILDELECGVDLQGLERRLQSKGLDIQLKSRKMSVYSKIHCVNDEGLIRLISAACLAVIASLSARRIGEITDLGADCSKPDSDGNYWLRIYIEKTSQRYDLIPIPSAVHHAIKCMERVSQLARNKTANDSIWQWWRPRDDAHRVLHPEKDLNILAEFNNLFVLEKYRWHFSAHQFRRFFAILYFWRYELGDLAALSHHLRHFDIEQTRRYVTDAEFGRVWKEVEQEWQADFLRGVVHGSRSIGGVSGKRLKREVSKLAANLRKRVDVLPVERAVQKLQRLAKKWGSEFRQHVWGTICACPQRASFAAHAKCKGTNEKGPVFSNATESKCAMCPFAIHTERFFNFVSREAEYRADSNVCAGDNSLLEALTAAEIVPLEQVLAQGKCIPINMESIDEQ